MDDGIQTAWGDSSECSYLLQRIQKSPQKHSMPNVCRKPARGPTVLVFNSYHHFHSEALSPNIHLIEHVQSPGRSSLKRWSWDSVRTTAAQIWILERRFCGVTETDPCFWTPSHHHVKIIWLGNKKIKKGIVWRKERQNGREKTGQKNIKRQKGTLPSVMDP